MRTLKYFTLQQNLTTIIIYTTIVEIISTRCSSKEVYTGVHLFINYVVFCYCRLCNSCNMATRDLSDMYA